MGAERNTSKMDRVSFETDFNERGTRGRADRQAERTTECKRTKSSRQSVECPFLNKSLKFSWDLETRAFVVGVAKP